MKIRYRLFKRGQYYYSEDAQTGKQHSLKTGNRTEAQRLVAAKNEAINNAQFTLAIGQTYLAITDAQILTRTWKEVMGVVAVRGGQSTQNRCLRAFRAPVFETISKKPILQTTASDFLALLADGKSSTRHYLKLLHSAAFELGWLAGRTILTRKAWTPVIPKPKRAITWDEHSQIIASEQSPERQLFYEMLWETGASQTDASRFSSEPRLSLGHGTNNEAEFEILIVALERIADYLKRRGTDKKTVEIEMSTDSTIVTNRINGKNRKGVFALKQAQASTSFLGLIEEKLSVKRQAERRMAALAQKCLVLPLHHRTDRNYPSFFIAFAQSENRGTRPSI